MRVLGRARAGVLVFVAGVVGVCWAPAVSVAGLADGRVYEQVSPVGKGPNVAGTGPSQTAGYAFAAPGDGPAIGEPPNGEPAVTYVTSGPVEGAQSGADSVAVAHKTLGGWASRSALPRGVEQIALPSRPTGVAPSLDLSHFLFTATASFAPGNPATTGRESPGIYLAGAEGLTDWVSRPNPGTTPDPPLGHAEFSASLQIAGASQDLGAVYFGYYGTLVPEDASRAALLAEHSGANTESHVWGFYEWRDGVLRSAGELPGPAGSPAQFDKYGAEPAATRNTILFPPSMFNGQVSMDGSRAFFMSPDPDACPTTQGVCGGHQAELYVREDGSMPVLVSRDTLSSPIEGAPHGPVAMQDPILCAECGSFVFASADGSHAFFGSVDRLTGSAPEDGSVKMYEFNTISNTLEYLPGVVPPIGGVSGDGSEFLFVNTGVSPNELDLVTEAGGEKHVKTVTPLAQVSPSVCQRNQGSLEFHDCLAPVRFVDNNRVVVFETDAAVPGFNNGGGHIQVYRYGVGSEVLSCVSCPPAGVVPSGGAVMSNPAYGQGRGLPFSAPVDVRGVSGDGTRVFFDSPDALVPQDTNGVRDVYEWENGVVSLISAGSGTKDSFFLDNSESGDNVFFATADNLSPLDTDGGYDVYDARVGGVAPLPPLAGCVGDCQGPPSAPPVFGAPSSLAFGGEGNFPVPSEASTTVKAKPKAKAKKKPKKKKHRRKRTRGRSRAKRAEAVRVGAGVGRGA